MTAFEQGIIKYATEYRLSESRIAYILKRAMDHPASKQMLKRMPSGDESADEVEQLSHLLAQHNIDAQMQEILNEHLSGETRNVNTQ